VEPEAPKPADAPAPAPAPADEKKPPPEIHVIDEKEAIDLAQTDNVKLSLPTESDVEAWASPGLRIALGYGYSFVEGSGPAWSFRSHSVFLNPTVRLDQWWSLGGTFLYGTGPGGLRWSVTAEPTFHPWRQLSLAVGAGYGGLSVSDLSRSTGRLRGPDEVVSRYLVAGESLQECSGSALSTVLRAQYLFTLGPLASTGPYAQGNMQWTRCQVQFGRIDNETGLPIVLTQWWQQEGVTLGWTFAWR
jgi:hypothetical protein